MQILTLTAGPNGRRALLPASCHFTRAEVMAVSGQGTVTIGDEECCALVLSGTFDLRSGSTAWPSRGTRREPHDGRPVAVFLPPHADFTASGGSGEILLLGARRPEAPPATGRDALRQSPLLPLAGSGKAFDPGSGEWRPAETFPTAAESLPPRRMQQIDAGGIVVERVFPPDYKAATLTVDEAVLPDGTVLALAGLAPPSAEACLVYVRAEGELSITDGPIVVVVGGEAMVHHDGEAGRLELGARGGRAYVALAYAGK